jgi:hypothetical protein
MQPGGDGDLPGRARPPPPDRSVYAGLAAGQVTDGDQP